jgi:hypothetical protein
VTGAVSTAVSSTTGLVKGELLGSSSSSFKQGSETGRGLERSSSSSSDAAWAPTSWLFGAGKKLQVSCAVYCVLVWWLWCVLMGCVCVIYR